MTNKEKGRIGLIKAINYFGTNGYTVSIPLNDTQDYDLIVEKNNIIQTVQVKYTTQLSPSGKTKIDLRSTGGTKGVVYKRVIETDTHLLFVVNHLNQKFLIRINDIKEKGNQSTINLGDEYMVV